MTTYICTVGTSICTVTGLDFKHFTKRKLNEFDDMLEDVAVAEHFVMNTINKRPEAEFCRISAEVNSLITVSYTHLTLPTKRIV